MNRVEIKEEAKKIINGNKWNFWKPALILFGIAFGIAFLLGIIFSSLDNDSVYSIIEGILSLVLLPASVGLYAYILKMARGEEFSLDQLKEYYPFFVKILIIDILVGLLVTLGTILLIIPGIILALAYSMVFFCFIDNTDLEATDVLKKSKEMMKGYKWDYFVFNLSFIGWIILAGLTCGILYIWVAPYYSVSQALYYDKLSKKE